jgi:hypothetical protein
MWLKAAELMMLLRESSFVNSEEGTRMGESLGGVMPDPPKDPA